MRFVLGGSDTEMNAIESLVKSHHHECVYAEIDGARVDRGRAYVADGPFPQPGDVWVECLPNTFTRDEILSLGIDVIDHHHPGDIGYGRPPAEYWEASSLGQVCQTLGFPAVPRLKYIAAADHCLLAAYEGKCPDINPEDLFNFRMEFYTNIGDPAEHIRKLYLRALKMPTIEINGSTVYDISSLIKRDSMYLADMSCYYGLQTISIYRRQANTKYFVSNMSRRDIQYFLEEYAPTLGEIVTTYGDPHRQFAAAVIKNASED